VAWFTEKRSDQTRRNLQATYRTVPSRSSIREWHNKFMRTGDPHRQTGSRRAIASAVDMRGIRGPLVCSSQDSLRRCSRKLQKPQSTVHKMELHTYSRLHAQNIQTLQVISPVDHPFLSVIARHLVNFGRRKLFPKMCVVFTKEVTFGISARVNRHTFMIWISENRLVL
jgi:hypothetical protein